MRYGSLSSHIVRPTADRSAPNRVRHSPSDKTTLSSLSSEVKKRPLAGYSPNTRKKSGVTA